MSEMLKTTIIGASGYTGAELALMVHKHPQLTLSGLYVSANSVDAGKCISELHGKLAGIISQPVEPLKDIDAVAAESDVVFLATAHEVSHDIAPTFLKQGCQVFDLSGAFRVKKHGFYNEFYGFEHQHEDWLDSAATVLLSGTTALLNRASSLLCQAVTQQPHSLRLNLWLRRVYWILFSGQ